MDASDSGVSSSELVSFQTSKIHMVDRCKNVHGFDELLPSAYDKVATRIRRIDRRRTMGWLTRFAIFCAVVWLGAALAMKKGWNYLATGDPC